MVSKVLDNRKNQVVDFSIFDDQSAFVAGRQILHGIFVANEIVDDAYRKKEDKLSFSKLISIRLMIQLIGVT